ncbi:MAG: GNAT family N-acetyltransferase [Proteobacteria bacterium]|jgi:putative acetyltransferase|nr:GNAT family N-acetyltransferase [Pseudomonadota bacterium]
MPNFIIRQYTAADLPSVLISWENASRIAHPFLSKAFLTQERINIETIYMPRADTWVAEQNNEVVGFLSLNGNEVGAIFLEPRCHGTGIGKALMDKARSLHGNLEVEVFEANPIGRKFYDRYGFKLMETKHHEETGQSMLRLKFTEPL